jgi:hypothetical protein
MACLKGIGLAGFCIAADKTNVFESHRGKKGTRDEDGARQKAGRFLFYVEARSKEPKRGAAGVATPRLHQERIPLTTFYTIDNTNDNDSLCGDARHGTSPPVIYFVRSLFASAASIHFREESASADAAE